MMHCSGRWYNHPNDVHDNLRMKWRNKEKMEEISWDKRKSTHTHTRSECMRMYYSNPHCMQNRKFIWYSTRIDRLKLVSIFLSFFFKLISFLFSHHVGVLLLIFWYLAACSEENLIASNNLLSFKLQEKKHKKQENISFSRGFYSLWIFILYHRFSHFRLNAISPFKQIEPHECWGWREKLYVTIKSKW